MATDASDEGLGYVLGQVQNNREVVIGYADRKLLLAEKNYSVTEREEMAFFSEYVTSEATFMEYIAKCLLAIVPSAD